MDVEQKVQGGKESRERTVGDMINVSQECAPSQRANMSMLNPAGRY